MMARTEIRMVFKSRQVRAIPIILIAMSAGMSVVIVWMLFSFGIPDPLFFTILMSSTMGLSVIMMPVMLPIMIAADSIVGEKERNTLVPLLATPLSDTELLLGKFLTALVPGIIVAYANLALAVALINGMAFFLAPQFLWAWPDLLSLIQALVMPLLFSGVAVGLMIIISGRVSKVYEAYQMAGVLILPVMIFAYSGFLQGTGIDWLIFIVGFATLLIVNVVLFRIAIRLFNRDKLISRL
jgi:ABC-type Na+ efflux pump permease subunit